MGELGISIYPHGNNTEDIVSYLQTAAKYGFTRIFTCLISTEGGIEDIQSRFGRICNEANKVGMKVVADVDTDIFKKLGLSWQSEDLKFFSDLGLYGIRLDLGFSGIEESIMSYNPYGLKIEINASNGTKTIDNILSHQANRENILGCHNFYPHRYTGLSRAHFLRCSKQFKDLGIRTAAFINSAAADHGPWPVSEGLCTLEEHRSLSVVTQAKDLFQTGAIDDVIIANAYASEEELKSLGALNRELLTLTVDIHPEASEVIRKILLEELHFNRGDVSDYLVRSTQTRVKYKGQSFPPFNTPAINKGDVLVESDLYARYAGEMQLALKPMENSGKTNVVARILEEEWPLLDLIEPWQKFRLVERIKP